MTSFTWVGRRDLRERYADVRADMAGFQEWLNFLEAITSPGNVQEVLSDFILSLQAMPDRRSVGPRVFISHRKDDADYGERIAWLASQKAGLEYWLDVHDPVLIYANTVIAPTNPLYPFIIAAIIEIGLLNCTHVMAAHTPPRDPTQTWVPSQWIPYEFGRVKSRAVFSSRAAGWFHRSVHPGVSR